jgi:hypothetical protein
MTGKAGHMMMYKYPIPNFEFFHTLANLNHGACRFMPENKRCLMHQIPFHCISPT